MSRVKYTEQGFSYVEVTDFECFNWGGMCLCNHCNEQYDKLYLVYVLNDTYCEECFNAFVERSKKSSQEDIEHDLWIQNENDEHLKWYSCYVDINE